MRIVFPLMFMTEPYGRGGGQSNGSNGAESQPHRSGLCSMKVSALIDAVL
jgi:hypothetical protein